MPTGCCLPKRRSFWRKYRCCSHRIKAGDGVLTGGWEMPQKTILSEAGLFAPLRDFFDQLGYEVHGEVGACDLTASKDDELIIVEMKRSLNMQVLIQAVKRQRLTSEVYIAIFRPHYSLSSRKWKDRCYLVRRLELGLIIVSFLNDRPQVDFVLHPTPLMRKKPPGSTEETKPAASGDCRTSWQL